MLQTVRKEKVHEKNGTICLAFMLWSWNCLKKCIVCNFLLTSARNLIVIKQFTYKHLKGLVTHSQKMVLLSYEFQQSIPFFDILFSILWTVAQAPINQIIFYKNVVRTFRCIYMHRFNRFRFLAEVSIKLQITHFLNNLRAIT